MTQASTSAIAAGGSGTGARVVRALALASVVLALAAGAAELLAGVGYRLHWWGVGGGIRTMMGGTGAALLALVLGVIALGMGPRLHASRRSLAAGVAGVAIGAVLAVPPLVHWRQAARLPPIHDISTDTENPPRFVAVLPLRGDTSNPIDYSAEVAQAQKAGYPDLAPLTLALPPAKAFALAEGVARDMGWDIVAVSPADMRIEATATTLLFGFKDDVAIRITPAAQGSRVDVRSVSRVGHSDLGTNAKRIRAYLDKLESLRPAA
ncbi:MAG TPA: DUF1499 domain-containing protein [Albitalea sp.]|uniref:DUF1499 domain-containing protein n=1 Tax=Piscinibacter sp. TaxID=1903157 RepID=UPI002ED12A37